MKVFFQKKKDDRFFFETSFLKKKLYEKTLLFGKADDDWSKARFFECDRW